MPKGTLIAAMNIGRAAEDEFQDWYDTEHLPERQRVPGFLHCQRWVGVDDRTLSLPQRRIAALPDLRHSAPASAVTFGRLS